jgi:probable phosphoglycerate mutase
LVNRVQLPSPASGRHEGPRTFVWLLRHPEVREDWRARAYGSLDAPLGDSGLEQAERVGAWYAELGPARVVASPLSRARVLAEHIAARAGRALALDERLRELDRGRWQGRRRDELESAEPDGVRAYHDDPWNWRGHGGETDADIHARAWPALSTALEHAAEFGAAPLVLVTHYNVARVLCARALGIPPARSFALRLDPARGILLALSPDGWSLLRSNVLDPRPLAPQGV